jgi:aconitate hydratase 2/2-methylisocitrate dehydratase
LTDENAAMLQAYREHTEERAREGIPPKPLDARQTADLVELIKNPPAGEADYLLELLTQHVPAGVDEAAYVKAGFLAAITRGEASTPLIDGVRAVEILGTMLGGYNIEPLIACLDDDETAPAAVAALSHTLLVFDAFHDVVAKSEAGNAHARQVLESWANADWFTSKPPLADKITVTVFKVPGETNTEESARRPDRQAARENRRA